MTSNQVTSRVKSIISNQGEDIVYRRRSSVSRSSSTLKKTITYAIGITIKGSIRGFKDVQISGLIQQGDRELRIAADEISFIPEENDKIDVNGVEFNVQSVVIRRNRNTDAVYIIKIRGKNPQPSV